MTKHKTYKRKEKRERYEMLTIKRIILLNPEEITRTDLSAFAMDAQCSPFATQGPIYLV